MSDPLECYFSLLRNSYPGGAELNFVVMNDDALTSTTGNSNTRCSSPPTCIPHHPQHCNVLPLKDSPSKLQHPSTRRCSLDLSDDSAPDCPVRQESAENIVEDITELYRERRKQRKASKSKTSTLDKFYGEVGGVSSPTSSTTTSSKNKLHLLRATTSSSTSTTGNKPNTVKRNSLDSKIQQLPTSKNYSWGCPAHNSENKRNSLDSKIQQLPSSYDHKMSSSFSDGVTSSTQTTARTALFRGMVADVLLETSSSCPPTSLRSASTTNTPSPATDTVKDYLDRVEAVVGLSSPITKRSRQSRQRGLTSPPSATRRDTRWVSALSKQMATAQAPTPVPAVTTTRFEQ